MLKQNLKKYNMSNLKFTSNDTPMDFEVVSNIIKESGVSSIGNGTIREIVKVANQVSEKTGKKFIRMEMGVPGIKPSDIGTNAEIAALKRGVAADYPMLDGIPELKYETARFVKSFLDIDVDPEGCIPTVGSMQGGYASFLTLGKCNKERDHILFIDPGFPVQKQQMMVIGDKYKTFDVYNFRGEKLREKLEEFLSQGNISSIVYSNPNNPSWICFTEEELQIIGELANKYDVIIIEDLAYFAMDFRNDLSKPGQAPFQPTVAKYTKNFIMLISSSKAFSYAGQRTGLLVISPELYHREYPELEAHFTTTQFGYTVVNRILYALSSGTSHSAQYAIAAMFKAANDGEYDFVADVKLYGDRAKKMKQLFLENGFNIVYDKDQDVPLADGFYFTVTYKNMTGAELLERLLYYGISAISLSTTGSEKEGLRACTSQTHESQFEDLEFRLKKFNEHHS